MLDPKWLDFLKTSGWQTTALAAASGILIWLRVSGLSPVEIPDWIILTALVVGVVSGCLAVASWGSGLWAATELYRLKFARWQDNRALKKRFIQYIPHLTPVERKIFAYLLAHNQRTFTAAIDGGHAAGLIGMGFIGTTARPGQRVDMWSYPMGVADPVWDALVERKDEFPHTPEYDGYGRNRDEREPWRVPVV
jgi:hypothetical protein